jgi:choline-sulfatase
VRDYNVLFIISDEHHRNVLGCYGNDIVETPNIDGIAREGVRFRRAYCQEPICGPSRACVMTGTYPHTCNAFSHKPVHAVPPDMPTLGTAFRGAGYRTGSMGKVHVLGENKQDRDLGFDDRALRFYTYNYKDYEDLVGVDNVNRYATHRAGSNIQNTGKYNPANEPVTLEDNLMYDNIVTDLSIEFMEKNRNSRFFLWMGIEKPHPAWYAPKRFHDMYSPEDMPLPATRGMEHGDLPRRYMLRNREGGNSRLIQGWTDEERRGVVAAYYANVSYMDMNVGRALDALDRLGIRDRTIVVYTTDHGEMLMEHSLFQKHCMYEAAVGVPLVISCPGVIPEGLVKESIVELIDLFPTLTDMTGVPRPDGLEGHSLIDLVSGPAEDESRAAFAEYYPKGDPAERMIRTGRWKYIYSHGDIAQLYDMEDDPDEMENLAVSPEYREICSELEARVMEGWEIDTFEYDGEGSGPEKAFPEKRKG